MSEGQDEKKVTGDENRQESPKVDPQKAASAQTIAGQSSPPQAQRPQAAPPKPASVPTAPSPKTLPRPIRRRPFLKFLAAVGALLALAPYVPWGEFLSSSVNARGGYKREQVFVDDDPTVFGSAAGKPVSVADLTTFQPNNHWVITYPTSGDRAIDAQNRDTFVKFELIRIPVELGGDKAVASSFVALSKVCVHLWCSPNYIETQKVNPKEFGYTNSPKDQTHQHYECPCHGSTYEVPDGLAIDGPAALQPPPTNAIPMLTLTTDNNGFLFVEPPLWDVMHNGILGLGRYIPGKTTPGVG